MKRRATLYGGLCPTVGACSGDGPLAQERWLAVFNVGLDLGKRKSSVCVEDMNGNVVAELRVDTKVDALRDALAKYKGARVLIEASTSSEWVARLLESLDLEVIVGDPRFDLMYAQRDRKVKNDRRDARALAMALRMGAYRRAHRRSDKARKLQSQLLLREGLIGNRTKLINVVRNIVQLEGRHVDACTAEAFPDVVCRCLGDNDALLGEVSPAVAEISSLNEAISLMDVEFEEQSEADPAAKILRTVRGVGALTALAFVAVIDDPKRFECARAVTAYLGLVPSEHNTGDSQRPPGAITKAGNRMLRAYLVSAAFVHTNKNAPDSNLKRWRESMTARQGKKSKKKAAVAVARRLARVLWAMWRDMKPFDDDRTAPRPSPAAATPATTTTSAREVPMRAI